jgi:2-polyprenyl-3-methyl-5-hydroxy-6-metoxy-1,4-benzoquinol methylase
MINKEIQESTVDFYDTFSAKQARTGINLRHYTIFREAVRSGLKSHHNVLEIGCGIGTFTYLLTKYIKKGKIVAADISPKSIEIASKTIKHKNIEFAVTDMMDYETDTKFDYVILPDVMEHIPVEQHPQLFRTIRKHSHDKTVIFIHIPHPFATNYIRRQDPDCLQIIDQELEGNDLLNAAYASDYFLHSWRSYGLYKDEPDNHFVVFKRHIQYEKMTQLKTYKIILRKARRRLFWILKTL